MKRFFVSILLLPLFSACSVSELPSVNTGVELLEAAPENSVLDELADGIVEAGNQKERALRVCLFATIAAEVYSYRLLYYGGEEGELKTAYGTIAQLATKVHALREQEETLWFETDMFYVVVGIVRAVEGPLRGRARGLAGTVALLDWRGIARGLRTSGGQALLAGAMVRDAKRAAALMRAGDVTLEQGWAECEGRLQRNLEVVSGALGVGIPPMLLTVPDE
jgi:hypothetical protein